MYVYLTSSRISVSTFCSGVGRDSVVGITTCFEMEGPGIESRWGRVFPHLSRPAPGPRNLLYNGNRVSFPGVKPSGRGVDHPQISRPEVKERAEPYLFFPCERSCRVLGWTYCCSGNAAVRFLCVVELLVPVITAHVLSVAQQCS